MARVSQAERELQELLSRNDQLRVLNGGSASLTRHTPSSLPQSDPGQSSVAQTKQADPWTETERRFAQAHLQPALERGEYLWYMSQVTIYMLGQTYTVDFVALRPDGGADHFEVKGKKKLGSQDRSSVKVRWATAFLQSSQPSPHRVYWAREQEDGQWHLREIKLKTKKHAICK